RLHTSGCCRGSRSRGVDRSGKTVCGGRERRSLRSHRNAAPRSMSDRLRRLISGMSSREKAVILVGTSILLLALIQAYGVDRILDAAATRQALLDSERHALARQ